MDVKLDSVVEKAVNHFAHGLRELLGKDLLAVKLFGSHARGKATPDSDIDMFVLVRELTGEIGIQISDIAFETNLTFDLLISPIVYGENEFHNPILQETPFLQKIEQEGIPV